MGTTHDWDGEYRSGKWDYFRDVAQAPRYAMLAEWFRRLSGGGTILDVACGEAVLLDYLRPADFAEYHGFDLAASAVARALKRIADPGRVVITRDTIEQYVSPHAAFDAVVFNECLYFTADPISTVRAYSSRITLISIGFVHAELASAIENAFRAELVESLSVTDRIRDKGWRLLAIERSRKLGD